MNGEWDLGKYVRKWSILLGIAAIAGLVGGLGALAFRLLIEVIHSFFFSTVLPRISYEFYGLNLGYVLLPVSARS